MDNINPLKQNARIQQFFGWFMAIFFPFTAKGLMEITKMPIIVALVYWGICGILLRCVMDKKLPYFHSQANKIKKEIFILSFAIILYGYLCARGRGFLLVPMEDEGIKIFLFAVLNGCFEQLVWINIFDLAGCKKSILGIAAVFVYVALMNIMFFGKIMPMVQGDTTLFIISQSIIFTVLFFMYIKTRDITIWSIQYIIYNLFVVFLGGFKITIFCI